MRTPTDPSGTLVRHRTAYLFETVEPDSNRIRFYVTTEVEGRTLPDVREESLGDSKHIVYERGARLYLSVSTEHQ